MTTHTAITDYYAGADLDDGSLLCHRTTDATVYTASVTPELTTGGGVYAPVFANVAAGRYRLKLLADGEVVATRDVQFAGTPNEVVETGVKAALDPATRVKLDASQPDYDLPTNTELNAAIAASQLVITTDTADIPRYGDLQRFDQSANNSGNKTADVTITKLS